MLIWTARQLPSRVNLSSAWIRVAAYTPQHHLNIISVCMRPYKIYYTCSISSDRLLKICLHNNIIGGCTITFSFMILLRVVLFPWIFIAFKAAGRSRLKSCLTRCEMVQVLSLHSHFRQFQFWGDSVDSLFLGIHNIYHCTRHTHKHTHTKAIQRDRVANTLL